MTSRHFFSKSIAIERTIKEIYAYFAALDCYSAKRRAMWRKLSQDEEGHALDLELASRMAEKNDDIEILVDISALDSIQKRLDETLAMIGDQPPDDAQAVKMAVEIEAQTMKVHARTALMFNDPELKRLFSSLGTYDKAHLSELAQAYTEQFDTQPSVMLQGGFGATTHSR